MDKRQQKRLLYALKETSNFTVILFLLEIYIKSKTLLLRSFFIERRKNSIGHFINDRRISARGRLSLLMFTTTLTVTSISVWAGAFFLPREPAAIMVTFHAASLYAIWKIKPYRI